MLSEVVLVRPMYLTRVEYGMLLTTSPPMSWSSFAMVRPAAAVEASSPKEARLLKVNFMTMENIGLFSEGHH
jgi:hypothetical protein